MLLNTMAYEGLKVQSVVTKLLPGQKSVVTRY